MKVTRNRLRTERVMAETNIAPEATDLLFEAEDVAEIIVEITGEDVDVEADGDEEVLESSTQIRGKRRVSASTVRKSGRKISAGKHFGGKTVRRLPRR